MKQVLAVIALSIGALAQGQTVATFMGLHEVTVYEHTYYQTCLTGRCITDKLIGAAADFKDADGVIYTVATRGAKDPIRQFAVGDPIQFRVESKPTKKLTYQQEQNRPLVPFPDTSQNVLQQLVVVMRNGKEQKYEVFESTRGHHDKWPFNPTEKPEAHAGSVDPVAHANAAYDKAMDTARQVMEHQAPTMSEDVLRQMCSMGSGEHNFYQPYCDELKKRTAPAQQ
jgi:hypothetical protein